MSDMNLSADDFLKSGQFNSGTFNERLILKPEISDEDAYTVLREIEELYETEEFQDAFLQVKYLSMFQLSDDLAQKFIELESKIHVALMLQTDPYSGQIMEL